MELNEVNMLNFFRGGLKIQLRIGKFLFVLNKLDFIQRREN